MANETINGTTLSRYGVDMLHGSYAELLKPAELKEAVSNEIPAENGIEIYSTPPKVKARAVSLFFLITGKNRTDVLSKYQSFIALLMSGVDSNNAGINMFTIPYYRGTFRLRYEACTSFECYETAMKLAVTFTEAKPMNYAEMTAEISEE